MANHRKSTIALQVQEMGITLAVPYVARIMGHLFQSIFLRKDTSLSFGLTQIHYAREAGNNLYWIKLH
ncbi:MAG: hypothetical protein AAB221_15140 [Bacteroidota bacterium]